MIAAWMLYSLASGVLLACAAAWADRFARATRMPTRGVWVAAMLAVVVLSLLALMPRADPESLTGYGSVDDVSADPGSRLPIAEPEGSGFGSVVAESSHAVYGMAARLRVDALLGVLWLGGTTALLLVFIMTVRRISRARSRWQRGRIEGIDVFVSRDAGPAVVGLLRATVVVPAWLAEAPELRRLVVSHEAEHRRACDHLLLAGGFLLVCALPWHAPLWWMLRRLRLAVELDCDARVLRRGATAAAYGAVLLEVAGKARRRAFAPALVDSRTHLERRLVAMTESKDTRRPGHAAIAGMAALLAVLAACRAELPTAAAVETMDVAEARARAEQAGLIRDTIGVAPLFFIDGVRVTERIGRALSPEAIESIEVIKGAAAEAAYGAEGRDGVILITTKSAHRRAEVERELVLRNRAETAQEPGAARPPLGVPIDEAGSRRERETTLRLRADEAAPLIIIDGVIVSGRIRLLDLRLPPDSIDSIEIVKGAAAAALYDDPRAVNGVIHIRTKTGRR